MLQWIFHAYFDRYLEMELLVLTGMHILHFDRCCQFLLRKDYANLSSFHHISTFSTHSDIIYPHPQSDKLEMFPFVLL